MNFFIRLIGSFGYSGFFPFAPATFASFIFVVIYIAVPGGEVLAHPIVVVVTLALSVPISTRLENRYGHDPSCVVIDEVVGMQVMLVWATPTVVGAILAFFMFRFFDIVKVPPAQQAQRLPGGYGIVCDDFIAGLYARAVLILLSIPFSGLGHFI